MHLSFRMFVLFMFRCGNGFVSKVPQSAVLACQQRNAHDRVKDADKQVIMCKYDSTDMLKKNLKKFTATH